MQNDLFRKTKWQIISYLSNETDSNFSFDRYFVFGKPKRKTYNSMSIQSCLQDKLFIYIYTVYNFSLLWSSALLKVVEFQYQPSYIFKWFDLTANHIKTLQLLKVRSFVVEKTCVCVCIQECTFTCNATGTVVRCGLTAVEKRVAREGNSLPSVIWNVNDFWEIFRNENLYIWWVSPNSNSTSLNHKSIIKTPILASIVSTNSI